MTVCASNLEPRSQTSQQPLRRITSPRLFTPARHPPLSHRGIKQHELIIPLIHSWRREAARLLQHQTSIHGERLPGFIAMTSHDKTFDQRLSLLTHPSEFQAQWMILNRKQPMVAWCTSRVPRMWGYRLLLPLLGSVAGFSKKPPQRGTPDPFTFTET